MPELSRAWHTQDLQNRQGSSMGRCLTEHYSASGVSTQHLSLQGQNAVQPLPGNLRMRQENIYPWLHIHRRRTHIPLAFIPSHTQSHKGCQRSTEEWSCLWSQATLASVVDVGKAVQVAPCWALPWLPQATKNHSVHPSLLPLLISVPTTLPPFLSHWGPHAHNWSATAWIRVCLACSSLPVFSRASQQWWEAAGKVAASSMALPLLSTLHRTCVQQFGNLQLCSAVMRGW